MLFGVVNPSGKLTETVPLRLEDTPAFGNFPGEFGHVRYGEGILVGYRWYDARALEVAYPFGHGLSYTTFAYGAAVASVTDTGDLEVTVPITNTGAVAGREVVQVYAGPMRSVVQRAPRELRGFASVEVAPGETRDAVVTVRRDDLAYWDVRVDRFVVEGGAYRIEVAASSRDVRAETVVEIVGDEVALPLTMNSSVADVFAHPITGPFVQQLMAGALAGLSGADTAAASMMPDDDAVQKMMASFPIGRIAGFPGMPVTYEQIEGLIDMANAGVTPDPALFAASVG